MNLLIANAFLYAFIVVGFIALLTRLNAIKVGIFVISLSAFLIAFGLLQLLSSSLYYLGLVPDLAEALCPPFPLVTPFDLLPLSLYPVLPTVIACISLLGGISLFRRHDLGRKIIVGLSCFMIAYWVLGMSPWLINSVFDPSQIAPESNGIKDSLGFMSARHLLWLLFSSFFSFLFLCAPFVGIMLVGISPQMRTYVYGNS